MLVTNHLASRAGCRDLRRASELETSYRPR
jgi:hypothetical protein